MRHLGAVLAAVFVAALLGAAVAIGMRLGLSNQDTATPTPGSAAMPTSALHLANAGPVLFKTPPDGYSGTKPTTIGFSGDGSNFVTRIHWTNWSKDSAVGYGVIGLNNCTPDCAQGQVTYQDATITLTDPIGSPLVWGKMTEAISGQSASHWTYPKNWALDAS